MMIQDTGVNAYITSVLFPEPPGHDPEVIEQEFAVSVEAAKNLCQQVIDQIGKIIAGYENTPTSQQ